MPLPAGVVRVYQPDAAGTLQLLGEDRLRHTPKDEEVEIEAGNAFDVVASRVQTDYRELNVKPYEIETAFELTLRNRRRDATTVQVREPVGGEWKVVESSHPAVKVDADTLGFDVPVPAGGEVVVRYRVAVTR